MEAINQKTYIKSVSEFITQTFDRIKTLESESVIWFRGESSENYNLVPNLYRRSNNEKIKYCQDFLNNKEIYRIEQNIDTSFYRKSKQFFSNKSIENTEWNRYFLKQHYGIRTRLLDWSENALFALFFAINNNRKINENGKVWILSPIKLNNYSVNKFYPGETKFNSILTCGELEKRGPLVNDYGEFRTAELLRKYYRMECNGDQKMYPLAIYPPHLDERMSAQQACFTLSGNIVNGLESHDSQEKFLECVYIDSESKAKILKELSMLGISHYSIYPDLDGLGKTINNDHFKDLISVQEENEFLNTIKKNF